jgi:hypothetical protein
MSIYTVQLDQPNASLPLVRWDVMLKDTTTRAGLDHGEGRHTLAVPRLEMWTPETLWMVLHELSAYIPAHHPKDALASVIVKVDKPRGRARTDGVVRPSRLNPEVKLLVSARGWAAELWAWRDETKDKEGRCLNDPGRFSEPMQAVILEHAARSPFSLSSVPRVLAADADERPYKPSRLRIQLGEDAPYDEEKKEHQYDIQDVNRVLRRILNSLDQGGAR